MTAEATLVDTGTRQSDRRVERVAILSPLPPTRSGVAHYTSMILPALAERLDVRAFDRLDAYRRSDFDEVIYQLGNNPHHEAIYALAMREPGVIVLHDLVLHHLIVEATLARGDASGYVRALRENHGEAGAAWAEGRAAGLHAELGNFLFPASVAVARRSKAVIVHNRYAAERLRSFGVDVPIHVVPHPYEPERPVTDRNEIRHGLGVAPDERVIGFFGFLTSAKRAEVVLEAFGRARERDPRLRLLIVGEPAPNIDVETLLSEGVIFTGYASDDDFPRYYAAADRLVNLRYPSAGETSGTLIRALGAGKPVAVSDYAQFAEFPDDCVVKVPLGGDEVERLVAFFVEELPDPAAAQRRWLEENASMQLTVEGYLGALMNAATLVQASNARRVSGTLPLFPSLELVDATIDRVVRVTVRNRGPETIPTRTYDQPEYRLIARLFARGVTLQDRWLALPRDLRPGETTEIEFPLTAVADELEMRLYHALQDVPAVDPRAWATVRLTHVR